MHLLELTPTKEELAAMTFQIGIVTSEGVLLASDLKATNFIGFDSRSLVPKIIVDNKRNFAHCSAGDDAWTTFTRIVAETIDKMSVRFADGDQEEIREILIDCVKKARGIEARDRRGKQFRGILPAKRIGGESLLVFRGNGIVSLWKVVTQGPYPNAWRVPQDSYERAGTPNNAAGFFLNNYFHQVPSKRPDRPS
jgi:hypothetical protein